MILRKLQIFVLGFSLATLGVLSENSSSSGSLLLGKESSSSPSIVSTVNVSDYNAGLKSEDVHGSDTDFSSSSSLIGASERVPYQPEDGAEEPDLQDTPKDLSSLISSMYDESASPSTVEGSESPLMDKSVSREEQEKFVVDQNRLLKEFRTPKSQEESLLLLNDPNYTADDALLLLRKQRRIHDNARGLGRQASEHLGGEYDVDKTVHSVSNYEYDAPTSHSILADQSVPPSQDSTLEDEEDQSLLPKELSRPKVLEKESSINAFPLDLESSKKRDMSERSQRSSTSLAERTERAEFDEAEQSVVGKPETSIPNPLDISVSDHSKSKDVYDMAADGENSTPSEKESSSSQALETVDPLESQLSQEEDVSSVPKTQEELPIEVYKTQGGESQEVHATSSISSPDESEVEKTTQSAEDNEVSRSSRMEAVPIAGSYSGLEVESAGVDDTAENLSEVENENLTEAPQSIAQENEIIPERYESEPSINRSLLEAGEPSQVHLAERSQINQQLEASPILHSEAFRNEDSANRLRGILLPLIDMFQIAIGCAAPCPYQRYFIQTDRVLKYVSKVEAKTIEFLNIMKKAREVTIKDVSDVFKFHQTAAKRRALLFVQKHTKLIKLMHFKVDSAKRTILLGLNLRILLQLLPSKYSREYMSEDLERINTQVELALKEYANIRKILGSKTVKYGLMKFLSLSDYDRKIHSVKSNLEAELSVFTSKIPTFQKFVSRHKKLASSLYDMMEKAGYPVKKKFFMIDRKGLTKEQLRLYKKKVSEDNKQAKNRLGRKEYNKFKRSDAKKWEEFSKVYSG